jgi:hypothetical protein
MVSPDIKKRKKALSMSTWLWGTFIICLWMMLSPSSLMILSLGMLPTLVAVFCDRTEHKYGVYCVGGFNFCGMLPFLLKLISDHSLSAAMNIMSNVFSLAIIFGAAGLGWLLFLSIPPVISTFLIIMSDSRVKSLKTIQQRIIDEWGSSVVEDNELRTNLDTSDEDMVAPAEAEPHKTKQTE